MSKYYHYQRINGDFTPQLNGVQPDVTSRNCKSKAWTFLTSLLVLTMFLTSDSIFAQVANYSFSQSTATYTALSTSTTLHPEGWDDEVASVAIPFNFRFNNVSYTSLRVNTNGYVTFGINAPSTTNFAPLSTSETYAGTLAAFARDLISNGSKIVTGVEGTSPSRVFVIQWTNARRYEFGDILSDVINFQIRLYETSNRAEVRFGTCTTAEPGALPVQSGIRGTNVSDFKNRTTSSNWSDTTAGAANTETLATSSSVMPASGLTFTWIPPSPCSGAPTPGAVSPANSIACAGVLPSPITVSGQTTGVTGLLYLWQESDDNGVADAWTTASGGSGGNTLTYQPPILTTTKYYRLRITCGVNQSFATSGVITLGSCTPPANDNPCGAVALTPAGTCTPYLDTTATSTTNVFYATNTTLNGVIAPDCAGASATVQDVWFKITATAGTHVVAVTPVAGFDAAIQIFAANSGTCGGSNLSLEPVGCVNGGGAGVAEQTALTTTIGQDYYFRVYRHPSGSSGTAVNNSQFSICVTTPVPACTANIAPANAQSSVSLTPTLVWEAAEFATSYDVYLGTSSANSFLANTIDTSYPITAPLAGATSYFWHVVPKNAAGAAVCGIANQTSFTTLNNCTQPTAPNASDITQNAASIFWTASIPAPAQGYQYEIRTSGAAGSGATGLQISGSTSSDDTDVAISGLTPGTLYTLYIRSACGSGTFSAWTSGFEFTTIALLPPTISGFTPTSICANESPANRTIVITGANFSNATAVSVNGTSIVDYTIDSDTQITLIVPSDATTGALNVVNADGTGTGAIALTINPAPAVADITSQAGLTLTCLGVPWQLLNATPNGVWTSSDETIATISTSGLVTGIALGTVTIRYTVTNPTTGCVAFKTYDFTISEPVIITANPQPQSVGVGANAMFTVSATGQGNPTLSYMWEISTDGNTFGPIGELAPFSGTNTATLTIANVPLSYNEYRVRCVVTGICNVENSEPAALSVFQTTIVNQPSDVTICAPSVTSTTFTATASADATAFQWQENQGSNWQNITNGGMYSGANTNTLTLSSLTMANDGWQYRLQTNGFTTAVSNAVVLTVNTAVAISLDPANQDISAGADASFTVAASGTGDPLTYQWERSTDGFGFLPITDDAQFSGSTTATLQIDNAPLSFDGNQFRCVVTGSCNVVNSAPATLSVGETTIITQPDAVSVCADATATASFTATASADATAFQWQENQGGNWENISDGGTYSGTNTTTLVLSGLTSSNNGWQYRLQATGLTTAISNAAMLNISQAVNIQTQPVTQIVCASGGSAVYTVSATGAVSYQWEYSAGGGNWSAVADNVPVGADYSGESTASLNISTANLAAGTHMYRVVVSGALPCAAIISDPASLTINTNATTEWFVDADGDGFGNAALPSVFACAQPDGYTAQPGDCNDAAASAYPNAAEIPFNGIDDDCDGSIDETGSLTTSLLPSHCGATLNTVGSLIGITTLAGHNVTGYRIRATNGAQVQTIETNVPHFGMTAFASYQYAATYTIDVQLQRDGVWQNSWGPACTIGTPAILAQGGQGAVIPAQCGATLERINTLIATTSLSGVTGYRFRITNLTDPLGPNAVQILDRVVHWFGLHMLPRYNFGTVYRVEVAVKTTGDFGLYGNPCEVSSPAVPSIENYCGATVPAITTNVATTSLAAVQQYRFQIVRASDNTTVNVDRPLHYFGFNSIPPAVFSPGALYFVRVAVMSTNTWSPFGDACEVIAPGDAAKGVAGSDDAVMEDALKASTYPNPFTSSFNVDLPTSSQEDVLVKVYDMLGKLVESQKVPSSELASYSLGEKYPTGVYNLILSQNGIVKTIRVIKR